MFENLTLLDGILAIVVVIGLLLGYKRGFFGTITKPLKVIASICLTVVIAAPIINAWTRPLFVGKVETWVYNSLIENSANITGENAAESMPVVLKLLAEMLKVDISGIGADATTEEILQAISTSMATPVGNLIAVVVTYAVLFIALMLILTVLIALLDVLFTKGILGRINKFLGLLLGGVIAAVLACVIANIAYKISPTFAGGPVSEFFKNLNPFAVIMKI
ncbi:MAG: CvpA family protein [Clostridia bacterium]|nr:CvpA family protein [Clostridia bacterium]